MEIYIIINKFIELCNFILSLELIKSIKIIDVIIIIIVIKIIFKLIRG